MADKLNNFSDSAHLDNLLNTADSAEVLEFLSELSSQLRKKFSSVAVLMAKVQVRLQQVFSDKIESGPSISHGIDQSVIDGVTNLKVSPA